MKALFVALVAFATVAAVMAGRSTSASFADQVTSNNNSFSTSDLVAPTLGVPTVTGTGATATVALSWNNISFQTTFDVLRSTGTCAATDPSSPVSGGSNLSGSTTALTDTPGAAGTYCYAIRAEYQSWTEVSNEREVTVAASATGLRIHKNNTLSTASLGAEDLEIDLNSTWLFRSTSSVTSASGASAWTVVLVQKDRPSASGGASVTVQVWSQDTSCTTGGYAAATAARKFATATVTVPQTTADLKGITLSIAGTGAASYAFDGVNDVLCLSIENNETSGSSRKVSFYTDTASTTGTTGVSRLEGPFAP